ncbi:MAG: hypothetical protein R3C61_22125 [Bacteroidia bacterium]
MARICHLTVLNPVTHTRIYGKIAYSQQRLGHDVFVVGQGTASGYVVKDGVNLISFKTFGRLSFRRVEVQIRILRLALKTRAEVYTIHTPELIPVALILKFVRRAKLIYDVHEDYAANIRFGGNYPGVIQSLLASGVRWLEKWVVAQVHAVSFAEDCYGGILAEPEEKRFFLRNKFRMPLIDPEKKVILPPLPFMLYSGTIAPDWGIFETIRLWDEWNTISPLYLVVAGHSQQQEVLKQIGEKVALSRFPDRFLLVGGGQYVEHTAIVQYIQGCTFGTALYHIKPHIQGKIPTRFYEYMAFGKPLVFTADPFWERFNENYRIGVSVSEKTAASVVYTEINTLIANPEPHREEDYLWSGEEGELRRMMDWVLSDQNSSST